MSDMRTLKLRFRQKCKTILNVAQNVCHALFFLLRGDRASLANRNVDLPRAIRSISAAKIAFHQIRYLVYNSVGSEYTMRQMLAIWWTHVRLWRDSNANWHCITCRVAFSSSWSCRWRLFDLSSISGSGERFRSAGRSFVAMFGVFGFLYFCRKIDVYLVFEWEMGFN